MTDQRILVSSLIAMFLGSDPLVAPVSRMRESGVVLRRALDPKSAMLMRHRHFYDPDWLRGVPLAFTTDLRQAQCAANSVDRPLPKRSVNHHAAPRHLRDKQVAISLPVLTCV
jgi:hypothetical protein